MFLLIQNFFSAATGARGVGGGSFPGSSSSSGGGAGSSSSKQRPSIQPNEYMDGVIANMRSDMKDR